MKLVSTATPTQSSLVSIVTPCYNSAPFLAETIESVAAQTYPNIEHIVIDDGSTDGTWDVITRYASRVRAVRLGQNRGGSHARNRGVELARGEFLMFLDADDLITVDTIDALVTTIGERLGHIAFCNWRLLRQVEGRWIPCPAEVALPTTTADHLQSWLLGSWVPPCAILWHRTVYQRTEGWDETLTSNQDGDLMLQALVYGGQLIRAERGEAYYRAHSGTRLSVSANMFSADRLRSRMRVLEKLTLTLQRQARVDDYAESLGIAYQRLAVLGFHADRGLARECLQRGEAYTGRRAVSRTRVGRFLTRLVGLERKEQIASLLGRLGIMTPARRQIRRLRHLAESTREKPTPSKPQSNDKSPSPIEPGSRLSR